MMYKIESTALLKKMMCDYFEGFKNHKKKIAWCTSVGPAELLRSFNFEVYFPENHGALLGACAEGGVGHQLHAAGPAGAFGDAADELVVVRYEHPGANTAFAAQGKAKRLAPLRAVGGDENVGEED